MMSFLRLSLKPIAAVLKKSFLNTKEHVLNDNANLFLQKRTYLQTDNLHAALTNKFYRVDFSK